MVDLIPYAAKLLEATGAHVELSYEELETELPLIVLNEVSNLTRAAPDGVEILSDVTIQADVYEDSEQRVRELAIIASRIMTEAGFRRDSSEYVKEDNLHRQTMRFSTTVEEQSGRLYRGASY